MIWRKGNWGRAAVVMLSATSCQLAGPSALGDAYYDQGVALYNRRDFKGASPYFDYAVRNSPSDSNAYYYCALNYQQLGDWPRAKQMYREIVQKFPGSQAYELAQSVLQKYDPDFLKKMGEQESSSPDSESSSPVATVIFMIDGRSGSTRSPDWDRLPSEGKIYFERVGNSQHIEAEVNGRRTSMVFDTGAESCVFGKNHLQALGIAPPSGPPTGLSYGVGSGGVGTWTMPVTLKVGNIERSNFQIHVQQSMPTEPLLGQTFFKDFEITTDPGDSSIHFKKKGTTGSQTSGYDVPFRRMGNEIIVLVQVNGKNCPMIFDTGADLICFSPPQVSALGLSIPDDAQEGFSTGIGGTTRTVRFNVDRIKMGPIDKSNVEVSVVEKSALDLPLLGQNFFKDWQFSIDSERNVIHFVRR